MICRVCFSQGTGVFRLALGSILNGKVADLVAMLGIVCSSWSSVNVATSKRSWLTPYGDQTLTGVRVGNRMVARRGGYKL